MVLGASLIESWVSVNCRKLGNIRKPSQVFSPHWLPLRNPLQKPGGPFSSGVLLFCGRPSLGTLFKGPAPPGISCRHNVGGLDSSPRRSPEDESKFPQFWQTQPPFHFHSEKNSFFCVAQKHSQLDFPRGMVDKNPPAIAGVPGSVPGLGRSHMPRSNSACVPQLLSWCSRACALQKEKPL